MTNQTGTEQFEMFFLNQSQLTTLFLSRFGRYDLKSYFISRGKGLLHIGNVGVGIGYTESWVI